MENQEYKDELSKDEKEEQLLIRSTKAETKNLVMGGFFIALISEVFVVILSFINSCMFSAGSKGMQAVYRLSNYYNTLVIISHVIGTVGLIISAVGYKKSLKVDTTLQKFSAVGLTLGAIHAWSLVSSILFRIINALATVK